MTTAATFSDQTTRPVLYSFRRCPYAMRARLAIYYSGQTVELRNILLKDKPASMLAASPKGTVPVLVHPSGRVVDESFDIMLWALRGHDPHRMMPETAAALHAARELIGQNDGPFKSSLNRYKYHVRFPDHPQGTYRREGETFLETLEARLAAPYLHGETHGLADIAIFPFIRQFANVDPDWFKAAPYPKLRAWLNGLVGSRAFTEIMKKRPIWRPGTTGESFGSSDAD